MKYFPGEDEAVRLVQKEAKAGRLFEGLGLWLQRRAAIKLHEHMGLAPFLPYNRAARSVLAYYLLVKGCLSIKEKHRLKDAVREYNEDRERRWVEKLATASKDVKENPKMLSERASEETPQSLASRLTPIYVNVDQLILEHK
ncbi:MAG: hypothetical protein ACOYYS_10740 [Chloroflexota bacterium]